MQTMDKTLRHRNGDGGFSLVEVIIAAMLVLMLAYLVATMGMTGMDAQKYADRLNRVTEIGQSLVDEIQQDLQSSVRLYTDDATGQAMLGVLDLSSMPVPIVGRLPTLDSDGVFTEDVAGSEKTGNSMLFLKHGWTDEFEVLSGTIYRLDVYRLVYLYLASEGGGPRDGSPDGLNLVRWESEPLVNGFQVDSIADAGERAEVLQHLHDQSPDVAGETHDQVLVAFTVGEALSDANTLRQIQSDGSLTTTPSSPRNAPWDLQPDSSRSSGSVLYYRHHSVATNFAPDRMGVGRFGLRDDSGDGFPHGLEVQVVGPASARQILVHLSLVSTNNRGARAFHEAQVIGDTRDV